ncbi:hypothetical protein [Rhodococcus pyridinivorans]|uniref:hypothetical protein n=1 Tax=Rhodococcus pyridinivorans TaxID=103816 RepID=UPI003AADA62C
MTSSPTSHQCRAAAGCRGRTRDPNTQQWIPALTIRPDYLCPSCIRSAVAAAENLWHDYLELYRSVGDTTVIAPATGVRAPSPDPAAPINIHIEALMTDIADTAHRCAVLIAERLGVTEPDERAVTLSLQLVESNIDVLLHVPAHPAMGWLPGGESWGPITQDGVGLALRLIELHRSARATLGVTRGRDRMPLPCPRCEEQRLGRWHGADIIDCGACGSTWTEAGYRSMTSILADDYKEFA